MHLTQYLLAATSLVGLCASQMAKLAPDDDISFQIVPDKSVYSPHSKMLVKFLITNTGSQPVFIHRSIGTCESLYGHYDFHILNPKGLDVQEWRCSSEAVWPGMQTIDPVSELQTHWIELRPGRVFGSQEELDAPSARGVYRLKADLVPPRNFGVHQIEILAQKQMRILNSSRQAQVVTITVK